MYNINIISKCDDENIRVAIIAAVNSIMETNGSVVVSKMKHGRVTAPAWNAILRTNN